VNPIFLFEYELAFETNSRGWSDYPMGFNRIPRLVSDQKFNIRDPIVGMILLGVTEREEDDPSWDSNHTNSAIRGDALSL